MYTSVHIFIKNVMDVLVVKQFLFIDSHKQCLYQKFDGRGVGVCEKNLKPINRKLFRERERERGVCVCVCVCGGGGVGTTYCLMGPPTRIDPRPTVHQASALPVNYIYIPGWSQY